VLKSALPLIKGPVSIEGRAFSRSSGHNVVDGSGYLPRDLKSCPGMVPGQYGANVRTASNPGFALVDTKGVTLRGLEIRNFCIGVLILRTSNAVIADNRIVRNIGGAGVMLSGDDGKGGSTSNTTLDNKVLRNTFLENGDGLELTRGAAFNLIADNDFDGGTDNLEQSQGIEILWGNDNTVVRNRFAHYSDGLQSELGRPQLCRRQRLPRQRLRDQRERRGQHDRGQRDPGQRRRHRRAARGQASRPTGSART
jgi:3-dehydroshikimate dehydratase